jgi:protein O-mannosyl-transferase
MTGSAVVLWFARARWLRFALLWFVLHLLPTNSLLPRNDIVNDRQLYLALIGPAFAIAYASFALPARVFVRVGLVLMLSAICAVSTWQRNADYHDEIALWEAAARSSPHKSRVWNNLGYAYQLVGRRNDAIAAYEHALALDANHERARINLRLLKERGAY